MIFAWEHISFINSPWPADEEVAYQLIDFYEETKVKFADLSEDMLWEYINSGEPMWVIKVWTFTQLLISPGVVIFPCIQINAPRTCVACLDFDVWVFIPAVFALSYLAGTVSARN